MTSRQDNPRIRQDLHDPTVFYYKSQNRDKIYRLQVLDGGEWITCGCPNGMHRGGQPNCYHASELREHIEQS